MTQSDEFLSIQTPENILFGYEVAGLGSRFMAAALDTLVMLAVMFLASLAALFFGNILDLLDTMGEGWIIGIYSVLMFLIIWGYYVIFEMVWTGQTPGKRYMGLRVIGRDGSPVGIAASLIRNFIRLIDFIPAFYGLGVMTMFANLRTRRLGDLAAGTLVVFDKNVSLTALVKRVPVAAGDLPKETLWYPVERLSEAEVAIAEGWLSRRAELGTARQLIRPILTRLYNSMDLELEERLEYDVANSRLEAIVNVYRSR
ncbi:MAG: RDD family protein [Candidatus Promineifilaceae bacterium]